MLFLSKKIKVLHFIRKEKKTKKFCTEFAKIYGKKKSCICEIVKEKETHANNISLQNAKLVANVWKVLG